MITSLPSYCLTTRDIKEIIKKGLPLILSFEAIPYSIAFISLFPGKRPDPYNPLQLLQRFQRVLGGELRHLHHGH